MIGLFMFYPFMMKVKKIYEEKTGEALLPFDEWSEDNQKQFIEYMKTHDANGFVDSILNGVNNG